VVFVETGAMARRPSEAYFMYAAASRRRQRAGIDENHRAPARGHGEVRGRTCLRSFLMNVCVH
jgi:hypothetical protein